MDHDTLSSDDLIGKVVVDVQPLLDNPGKWVVDDSYCLQKKEHKDVSNLGELYVQAMYLKSKDKWD